MAMRDWNGDEKKNMLDDYIEQEFIINDVQEPPKTYQNTPQQNTPQVGISAEATGFVMVACFFSGFVETFILFGMIGLEIKDVSGFIIWPLSLLFAFITLLFVGKLYDCYKGY